MTSLPTTGDMQRQSLWYTVNIGGHLQSGYVKIFSCTQFRDHLQFIDFTCTHFFCAFVHFSESYANLRNDLRSVVGQYFINEALDFFPTLNTYYTCLQYMAMSH